MTVWFWARGAEGRARRVELSNGSARVVLALVGRTGQYLSGSMTVPYAKKKLAAIGFEQIAPHVASTAPDSTLTAEALSHSLDAVRLLVSEAERAGSSRIVWR